MEGIKIRIHISTDSAARLGHTSAGRGHVPVPDGWAGATDEERLALGIYAVVGRDDALDRVSWRELLEVEAPTWDAVLAGVRAERAKQAEEAKQAEAKIQAAVAQLGQVEQWDTEWRYRSDIPDTWSEEDRRDAEAALWGYNHPMRLWRVPSVYTDDREPRVVAAKAKAEAECATRNAPLIESARVDLVARGQARLAKAAEEAKKAEEAEEAKKAEEAARTAEWRAYVATILPTAPAHLRERHEAGVLPEEELIEYARSAILAPLAAEERYEGITSASLDHDEDCTNPGCKVVVKALDTLSAGQWARLQAIQALVPEEAEVGVRRHDAYCPDESCYACEARHSVRVTLDAHGRHWVADLACPD
jgi:hypothetical protein